MRRHGPMGMETETETGYYLFRGGFSGCQRESLGTLPATINFSIPQPLLLRNPSHFIMAPSAVFSCTSSNSVSLPLFSSKFSKKPTTLLKITSMLSYHNHCQPTSNWAPLASEITTQVIEHLPKAPPPAVTEPMHRLVSAAPPSVASALCLAACELVGGEKSHAMSAACAVQLMHAAAHAHTWPCLSGVDLMTADGLFPLGYEMVAASSDGGDADPETAVRVVLEMARAMGPQGGVVEGLLMMMSEGGGEKYWAWERKGGRMAACGAACGAIVGGGREEEVERLRRFGMYVGMANEMISSSSSSSNGGSDGNSYGEVVELFRSLARLELQGFDNKRVDEAVGYFQLGAMEGLSNKNDSDQEINTSGL